MRRAMVTGLAVLVMILVTGTPVLAQKPGGASTDIQIEMKRQRTIVKPPTDAAAGASEAEAAAEKLDEQRRAEELSRKAMQPPPPPLDESTVEGIRSKQLQELPRR